MHPILFIVLGFLYIVYGVAICNSVYKKQWNPIWKVPFVILWPIGFIFCFARLVIIEYVDEIRGYYENKK